MGGTNVINQMHSIPQLRELAVNDRGFIVLACGDTVPTDTTAGYEVGCIFIDTNAAAGSQLLINVGSATSCNFDTLTGGVSLAGLTATATELNEAADVSAMALTTEAGTGITTGTGTVYKSGVQSVGGIIITRIIIDLTGLTVEAVDGDIIGVANTDIDCHLGRITAAQNGTIFGGTVTCLEAPTTGSADIDLFSAAEATGSEGDAISGLTETALVSAGGAWTLGEIQALSAVPAANEYLYLTNGAGAGAGLYDAGKFLIELYGYDA